LAFVPHATELGPAVAPWPLSVVSLQTNWATASVGASIGAAPNIVTMPAAMASPGHPSPAMALPPINRARRLAADPSGLLRFLVFIAPHLIEIANLKTSEPSFRKLMD
jgi:hypothetical protein